MIVISGVALLTTQTSYHQTGREDVASDSARSGRGQSGFWTRAGSSREGNPLRPCVDRLVSLGAKQLEAVIERGPGFLTASVVDPLDNVLGIMYNRHYLEILDARPKRPEWRVGN